MTNQTITTDGELVEALARLIEEGTDKSYEEWKRGVKRPVAVCIAEHLIAKGVWIGGEG